MNSKDRQILGMPPEKESFIEKIAGAKPGTPESILKNAQVVNPHYGEGKGYDTNCQRCFRAYELRRRGHDEEATPNDESLGNGTGERGFFGGWECFMDAEVRGSLALEKPIEREALLDEIRRLPEGARAAIIWTWPDSNRSHIISFQKFNGSPIFVDPQKGIIGPGNLGNADAKYGYSFFRVDNLELKADFEWNKIIRRKK